MKEKQLLKIREVNVARKKENVHQGLYVKVKNNDVEYALKLLKRKMKDSGLMLDIRKNSHFITPSAKRRDKRALAKLRAQIRTRQEF